MAWYKTQRRSGKRLSEVHDLTLRMLGKPGQPVLRCKAAQCRHLLPWLLEVVRKYEVELTQGPAWRTTLERLLQWYSVLGMPDRTLTHEVRVELYNACVAAISTWRCAKGRLTPKFHLWYHMTQEMIRTGSARWHAVYIDESLNGTLRDIGRRAHPMTWSKTVFRRILAGEPTTRAKRS